MSEENDEIRVRRDGYVLTIELNRPAKLNAMTVAMDQRMNELQYEINNDDDVRVVVLTGAPGRAYRAACRARPGSPAEIGVGPSAWASGSQLCTGTRPTLVP